jgi:hypothetical protein
MAALLAGHPAVGYPVAAATVVSLAGLLWGRLGGDHAAGCPTARRP